MKISRRSLLKASPVLLAAAVLAPVALAQASAAPSGQKLSPSDPQAKALGYVDDATHVDKTKYPQYGPGQMCSGCQFYQGTASSTQGPCQIFQNKLVSAKGWCSSWTKKA